MLLDPSAFPPADQIQKFTAQDLYRLEHSIIISLRPGSTLPEVAKPEASERLQILADINMPAVGEKFISIDNFYITLVSTLPSELGAVRDLSCEVLFPADELHLSIMKLSLAPSGEIVAARFGIEDKKVDLNNQAEREQTNSTVDALFTRLKEVAEFLRNKSDS